MKPKSVDNPNCVLRWKEEQIDNKRIRIQNKSEIDKQSVEKKSNEKWLQSVGALIRR